MVDISNYQNHLYIAGNRAHNEIKKITDLMFTCAQIVYF